jgi:hypothetical protein
LGEDLHGEERGGSGRRIGSSTPAIFWREEMRRRERRREEEEAPAEPVYAVGRQRGWRPSAPTSRNPVQLGEARAALSLASYYAIGVPRWMAPCTRVRIWNKFRQGSIYENCFSKGSK